MGRLADWVDGLRAAEEHCARYGITELDGSSRRALSQVFGGTHIERAHWMWAEIETSCTDDAMKLVILADISEDLERAGRLLEALNDGL